MKSGGGQHDPSHVILLDFNAPTDWQFKLALDQITKANWNCIKFVTNQYHGSKLNNLIRYKNYFKLPHEIYKQLSSKDQVIAWQQFFGINLAWIYRFHHVKDFPKIYVMTFIYKKKNGFIGRIYESYIRQIIQSDYIKKCIVYSSYEMNHYPQYFKVLTDKFCFIKLGIEDEANSFDIEDHGYYISAGRSNRDYGFLIDAWPADRELKIVCDSIEENSKRSNIQMYKDCHDKDYLELLSKCHAVVLTLGDQSVSSGQLVMLQAMMMGKPVIVSENEGIKDYALDGVNSIFIRKTKQDLINALVSLDDQSFYQKMSADARKLFVSDYSLSAMGSSVGEIINKQ